MGSMCTSFWKRQREILQTVCPSFPAPKGKACMSSGTWPGGAHPPKATSRQAKELWEEAGGPQSQGTPELAGGSRTGAS